uniref:CSON014714 protein n=1 Tax=Culicoides sonorensis TaxID=179676 RepID=A0A336MP06_CULSO
MKIIILLVSFATVALAQKQYTTPVPILKQINRQNEDGSYSYGYEAADGSFKIETKYPTGEVQGKYGYVDDQGKVREVEYGASSKRGFEPVGTDIQVPPPTLSVSNANSIPLGPDEEDDGQYREDPSIYWKDPKYNNGVKHSAVKPAVPAYRPPATNYNSAPNQYFQNNIDRSAPVAPIVPQQPQYRQPAVYQPQPYQQPRYQPYQPAPQNRYYNPNARADFASHPSIQNFDINSGSYTINYGR